MNPLNPDYGHICQFIRERPVTDILGTTGDVPYIC
jgi:hypothetical protein